ncbi:MAG TPA: hypothetical protein VEV83_03875 [Parafilimonas sp.]|nr:hypothetical protein [Parafilimonas sp.]
MILLISNIANEAAPAWVSSLPAGAVSLITASDFNRSFKAGISVNNFSSSSLTINGYETTPDELTGVIVTIPAFSPIEFYYINQEDREYVCSEVNAFMNYFLTALKCKKINPPTRRSLGGLWFQKFEWLKIARKLNIPIVPFIMKNGKYEYAVQKDLLQTFSCTIINDEIMENENEHVHGYVKLLAKEFSLPYLSCYFSTADSKNFQLLDINAIPDITIASYRDAMLKYL